MYVHNYLYFIFVKFQKKNYGMLVKHSVTQQIKTQLDDTIMQILQSIHLLLAARSDRTLVAYGEGSSLISPSSEDGILQSQLFTIFLGFWMFRFRKFHLEKGSEGVKKDS